MLPRFQNSDSMEVKTGTFQKRIVSRGWQPSLPWLFVGDVLTVKMPRPPPALPDWVGKLQPLDKKRLWYHSWARELKVCSNPTIPPLPPEPPDSWPLEKPWEPPDLTPHARVTSQATVGVSFLAVPPRVRTKERLLEVIVGEERERDVGEESGQNTAAATTGAA